MLPSRLLGGGQGNLTGPVQLEPKSRDVFIPSIAQRKALKLRIVGFFLSDRVEGQTVFPCRSREGYTQAHMHGTASLKNGDHFIFTIK
jgi:hypothetical protein